jgi:hypothetical protein
MPFEDIMMRVVQLQVGTDALAAVGAVASTTLSGQTIDPDVAEAITELLRSLGLDGIADLEPPQLAMLAGSVRTYFLQASDLLTQPGRAPGWQYTDPQLLEGQGRGSAMIPSLIARSIAAASDVREFLDLGAGVAHLAIGAATLWPECHVVGLDTWEASLELARTNVANAGLEDRITLRQQNVVDLDDVDRFDLVWFPTFFFARDSMKAALAAVVAATRPGGSIVLGCYAPPPDPTAKAAMTLRTIRDGGAVLDGDSAAALLRDAGCVDVAVAPRDWPIPLFFVVGRRPN